MTNIPDPTTDLDWGGYIGGIHEIFHQNALKHPDKPCVTETASSTTQERRFTYRQIDEATNNIANKLREAGVTNGDVVMIFAYRSVELVCAYMGILAAGATCTVLDPLYPPARQAIYLQVSRPAALISIKKCIDENGPLAPLVREYIDKELSIKIEIPEIHLGDDGVLAGVEKDGQDMFASLRGKGPPDVLVGPDSNGTLSFTSGSEGLPKGVLGRHYSLTKYFPWMASKFDLTSKSVFACLSGIAHDPIQRDIMMPLFCGAQLLIPPEEQIQHEKLAAWLGSAGVTCCVLTPAMGQILVGGASAKFPSLRHVFFVGDVLTTRDCRMLRNLGENVCIVCMYGTTETSRAVSYFEVPPASQDPTALDTVGDTVPAGQGMENVQLLVIDRNDRTKMCGIGEVGELYVRAAGLAEGYLADPEKTREKFVPNWFVDNAKWVAADLAKAKGEPWRNERVWKGPRDILYRTGDLGQYLPSGAVRVSGRIDSQVKIRGFRIELNEIDGNLSSCPLVRDCKTLVRRDRNEEPTLVSYIVPEVNEWVRWIKTQTHEDIKDDGVTIGSSVVYLKRYRRLQGELRDYLKSRLPAYAIPAFYIMLQKLPLNPNRKVDVPSLPFPDVAQIMDDTSEEDLKSWETLSETEKAMASHWAALIPGLNEKTLRPESNFFDCGGHSLLAQQLLLNIRKDLHTDVKIGILYAHTTLRALSEQIDRIRNRQTTSTSEESTESDYAKSYDELIKTLDDKYQSADASRISPESTTTFFLTGATGFLGGFLAKDILDRPNTELIAHIRGAKDLAFAKDRLSRSLKGYGLWHDSWANRITCVLGDLSKPRLGLDDESWKYVAEKADVICHNGATVHWLQNYLQLLRPNVQSTIDAMKLCNEGRPKLFSFVSSTSSLDNDHYVALSHEQGPILEADEMQNSRTGLSTGYGQTKWLSEQLIRAAGKRGLRGAVVRPGYILGAKSGVVVTDDFLVRMLKGCTQLHLRPRISSRVNAVPADHVARVVIAAALNPLPGVNVVHVTAHPHLRMSEFLSALDFYGYQVPEVDYDEWKAQLEKYVSAGSLEKDQEQSALMPLFHMATSNLPSTMLAPDLDDRNAIAVLKADADRWTGVDDSAGEGITREDIGRYLRFLAETKFMPWPTGRGRELPAIALDIVQAQAQRGVGGRGAAA